MIFKTKLIKFVVVKYCKTGFEIVVFVIACYYSNIVLHSADDLCFQLLLRISFMHENV